VRQEEKNHAPFAVAHQKGQPRKAAQSAPVSPAAIARSGVHFQLGTIRLRTCPLSAAAGATGAVKCNAENFVRFVEQGNFRERFFDQVDAGAKHALRA
jgi:hypothetical protein